MNPTRVVDQTDSLLQHELLSRDVCQSMEQAGQMDVEE